MNKLSAITLFFWVMKICATTLGETAGDLLSMTLHLGYEVSTIILLGVFSVALATQMAVKTFHPALYWLVILATSTAGTTLSDFMDRTLGLGYATGAAILSSALVVMLALWRVSTGTLSVATIKTRRAELFYWLTILISNTLGTAVGDYLADDSGLGFAGGAAVIAAALCLIIAAYFLTKTSRTLLFWLAFILTRPFGATLGDVLTKASDKGGMDFGTIGSSAILLIILLCGIGYSHYRQLKHT